MPPGQFYKGELYKPWFSYAFCCLVYSSTSFAKVRSIHRRTMESANSQNSIGQSVVSPLALDEKHKKDASSLPKTDTKRVLANRKYSHKYRMKQLKYIMHLETEKNVLQAEAEIIGPRIRHAGYQNSLLRVENHYLRQRLLAFSNELMSKEAEYEEFVRERDMLKHIYEVKRHLQAEMLKAPSPSED